MKKLIIISILIAVANLHVFSQQNSEKAYDEVTKYNDSLNWTWSNGKQGMIDKQGNIIIPNVYDEISVFKEGLASTFRKGRQGLISINGKIIIPCKYNEISSFKDGIAHTTFRGKLGLIGINGAIILPNIYSDIVMLNDSSYKVVQNGKESIINKEEAKKIKIEAEELSVEKNKLKDEISKAKAEIRRARAEIKKAQIEMGKKQNTHISGNVNMNIDVNEDAQNVTINNGEIHVKGLDGEVMINNDSMVVSENKGNTKDTTKIIFKKGKILFISDKNKDEENNEFEYDDDDDDGDGEFTHDKDEKLFHGNLAGFEFGPNNFLNNKQQLDLPSDGKLLDINTSRSWYFGFNFMHKSFDFTKNRNGVNQCKVGMVAGLGLAFNNYNFDQQVILLSDSTPLQFTIDTVSKMKKNKLFIAYLTLPILFEYQYPIDDAKLHFAIGAIASLRIATHQKQIFENNEKFVKSKDFHLMPYKLEATARVGYGPFTVFANYSLTTLFENNKGPELYPVTVGLGLTF